jgi:Hypothetical glycosyl hydrolase family 15
MGRFSRWLLAGVVVMVVTCAGAGGVLAAPPAFAEVGSPASAGTVKFVKRTEPAFNHFMEDPTSEFVAWMNHDFWRAEVFSPYFDNKTSWYPHGWMYKDLYALYTGSGYAKEHENWILRNASGAPMFIPWGCSNGSCPQYAADIGNPEYRHAWIAEVKASAERGYAGLWIDDVNLEFRVGNGNGEEEAPIDPRTGRPMSETAWQEYVDVFLEEIRQAMPSLELLENSIWFAGGPERWKNPLVQRQIATADYINLERGVNDEGLTGGTGAWSLKTFLSFVDYVHSAGKGVILDGASNTPTGREYSLAAYYLISTGNDGLGNGAMTPENWWPAYNEDLGTPAGPRHEWEGLLRRDYTDGIALVNEPDAPTRTVTLPAPMYDTEGAVVTSVTLGAADGAVLRYVEPPGPGNGQEGPGATRHGKATEAGGPSLTVGLTERARKRGQVVVLDGRTSPIGSGAVQVHVQRLIRGRWVQSRTLTISLGRGGRFAATLAHLPSGRYQAEASVLASGAGTVSSGTVEFTVPNLRGVDARLARRAARARQARLARRMAGARQARLARLARRSGHPHAA